MRHLIVRTDNVANLLHNLKNPRTSSSVRSDLAVVVSTSPLTAAADCFCSTDACKENTDGRHDDPVECDVLDDGEVVVKALTTVEVATR